MNSEATSNANFSHALVTAARARAGRHCLVLGPDPAVAPVWTYADLDERSAAMAGALAALGAGPGERVAVQVEKSAAAIALYLGCLRVGAVFVPLNTAYTATEVEYFLGDAEPAVFVCAESAREGCSAPASAVGAEVMTLEADGSGTMADAADAAEPLAEVVPREPSDLAAIVYTSGTTGRSKGAMLTHANLASSAAVLQEAWGWRDDDVLLHALPVFHVHGLFVALHCALLAATPMIFLSRFDAGEVAAALPHATVMMGVPTFYTRLLERDEVNRDTCGHMRLFVSGSAPLTEQTFAAWEARTGHRILERYGMSETMMNTSNPLDGERLPGTVGFPLPGVEARITGDAGQVLPPGEIGVIEVRGPNVFAGYWGMPEKTAEEFRADGFFITGDLGQMDESGRISIVGRSKDLVISGGYNVYPKEIERLLDELPGVVESAVIGVPHPDFGEGVVAVLVTDGAELGAAEIASALEGRLARFKQPKAVFTVDSLPRNAMGKVQKNQLRDRYARTFEGR